MKRVKMDIDFSPRQFTFEVEEKNDWVFNLSKEEKDKQINKYLSIGKQFLDNTNFDISNNNKNDYLFTELNKITNSLIKVNSTSSLRGRVGEEIGIQYLNEIFPDYEIIDMSKTAGAGDIVIVIPNYGKIMVEIKNYRSNVTTEQVEKFERDMILNDYRSGLFISIGTKISGKEMFSCENVKDKNVLYIYGQGIEKMSILLGIKYLINIGKSKFNIRLINHDKLINQLESVKGNLCIFEDMNSHLLSMRKNTLETTDYLLMNLMKIKIDIMNSYNQIIKYIEDNEPLEINYYNNDILTSLITKYNKKPVGIGLLKLIKELENKTYSIRKNDGKIEQYELNINEKQYCLKISSSKKAELISNEGLTIDLISINHDIIKKIL